MIRNLIAMLFPALTAIVLLISAPGAQAHTKLLSSQPAQATEVPPPIEITLSFSEPSTPVRVILKDSAGNALSSLGPFQAHGSSLHYSIIQALTSGKYALSYRVTSADGHVTTGTVAFMVKENVLKE
jgi:methionine-rich copper-binding protein CopC